MREQGIREEGDAQGEDKGYFGQEWGKEANTHYNMEFCQKSYAHYISEWREYNIAKLDLIDLCLAKYVT